MYKQKKITDFRPFFLLVIVVLFFIHQPQLFSQNTKIVLNQGFTSVKQILTNKCLACHDWPGEYKDIVDQGRIVPFHPEKSMIYLKVEDGSMPKSGEKLTPYEKHLIKAWIKNGATESTDPITDSGSDAAEEAAAPGPKLPGVTTIHSLSGFTSTGLFIAAGIVSTVHFLTIMNEGHALEESGIATEQNRGSYMMGFWNEPANQALRWWHVGLLSTGEAFYLYNAFSGIGMWSKDQPGLTREKIHRWAFFLHATLMAAQIVLGFFETSALATGNHDMHIGIGIAHCVIGFGIPAVMLAAGLENIIR